MIIKARNVGAKAQLGRLGQPEVTSFTDAKIQIVTSASESGYNPLDLLFASLAGCLAISVRIVISELKLLDDFNTVAVSVTGQKSAQPPYRISHFDVIIDLHGSFDHKQKDMIAHKAELICTVSNTLRGNVEINLTVI